MSQFDGLRQFLKQGGVIAYATESCFGLGCDPQNRSAAKKILKLKRRTQDKGLILIASSFQQLQPYIAPLNEEQRLKTAATWPGPHTWLLPVSKRCPRWLRGKHDTLAVRVTAHTDAAMLCCVLGFALVSTSANRSGGKAARTAKECCRLFGNRIRVLRGRVGKRRKPSTIQDLATGRIIRG